MSLGIALVGCGAMGAEVARRVYAGAERSRYRLVAVVDRDPSRADAVAGIVGAPAFSSLDAAEAAGVVVDAVDLRLPHHLHADAAVAALERGRHVLVEKPLATTLTDATRIVDAVKGSGLIAAVAENYPHLKAVQAVREALASGDTGPVRALRTTRAYTLGGVWVRDGWRRGDGPSAGILLDQGTHHTSLLRQLGGEIVAVSAQRSQPTDAPSNGGETVVVTARFASGLAGQSLYTWGTPALDEEAEATVFTAKARIEVRVSYDEQLGHARWFDATSTRGRRISPTENYYDSHRWMVEDWISAIEDKRDPLVTVEDARTDLAVVLAAAESLEHGGRFIDIDPVYLGR